MSGSLGMSNPAAGNGNLSQFARGFQCLKILPLPWPNMLLRCG
ncbi:hypothetical protein R69749_07186 [Paraburkholderia domus]|uniref:Uncharacterized protein n=1 Tax=Paraburkholderia domus TaxID=2793075 RepID=A0A9N8NAB6_9BURK|nr:hypothetical protein R70006_07261 [Paraburkholderia domus]CAE6883583.1 hypothetical protein R69749_07186 [Paraburkholderia domus]CAE6960555.1 hypothetical protein R70199_07288 [Paraburkholderia domus]CAE6969069.1 hypothetical protein R70211_07657 [Paraburkholderia domus]